LKIQAARVLAKDNDHERGNLEENVINFLHYDEI